MEENNNRMSFLNIMRWVGSIGAVITGLAYLGIIIILVVGFETKLTLEKQIIFAIIGAVAGLAISTALKIQGISLAKENEENKRTMEEYNRLRSVDKDEKKPHTIERRLLISGIKDVALKGLTISLSTLGIFFIAIEGNGDIMLIALAVVNLLFFLCYGLIAMAKFYEIYNTEHMAAIRMKIELIKERLEEVKKNEQI